MREKGDKLLQVVMINLLLKASIFPSVFQSALWPRGGHIQPAKGPYIFLHPATIPLNPLQSSKASATLTCTLIVHAHTHTWEHVRGSHSTLSPPSLLRHPHQVIYFHRAASSNLFCVYRPWPDQPLWRNVMFTVRLPPPTGIVPQQIHGQGSRPPQTLRHIIPPTPASSTVRESHWLHRENFSQRCEYNRELLYPQENTQTKKGPYIADT